MDQISLQQINNLKLMVHREKDATNDQELIILLNDVNYALDKAEGDVSKAIAIINEKMDDIKYSSLRKAFLKGYE